MASEIVLGLVLSHHLGWVPASAAPTPEPPRASAKPRPDDAEPLPEWLLRTQGASQGDAAPPEPADQPLPEWLQRTRDDSDRDAGAPRAERNDQPKSWPTPPPDDGEHHKKRPGEDGGFDMRATFGYAMVPLAKTTFSGSGVPRGAIERQSFQTSGRALGLNVPAFWTVELGVAYTRRYLSLGILGAIGSSRGADEPTEAATPNAFEIGGMSLFGFAADIAGVLPVRPVTLRAGALAGVRSILASLPAYDPEPCGRDGQFGCEPQASATAPFLQPRATLDVTLGKGARVGALGAYLGMDLCPETAWSVGLSFSFRSPYWALAW